MCRHTFCDPCFSLSPARAPASFTSFMYCVVRPVMVTSDLKMYRLFLALLPTRYTVTLFFFFFPFVELGFELRPLHLQRRRSTAWATPPVRFALANYFLGLASAEILRISASHVARVTGMSHRRAARYNNYLCSIYIVLGIINNLEVI
jgi:hypothetical protein